jgi:hypothetical protein
MALATNETATCSLKQLRYAAIAAARAGLKASNSHQEVSDCIAQAVPAFVAAYEGEELKEKIAGVIRFACNQLRIAVPT